jgi:hypothetical protein
MIYPDAEDLFQPSFGFSCLGIKFDVAEGSKITVVHGVARNLEALGVKRTQLALRQISASPQPTYNDVKRCLKIHVF